MGEICEYGKCTNVNSSSLNANDWILDLEDIEKETGRIIAFHSFKDRKTESTKHKFYKGQVLYSKLRPYLNKVVIAPKDGFCTSEIIPLDFNGILISRYAQIVLMSSYFLTTVNMITYGVKMPRLGTEDAKKLFLPLPPLTEQQLIVAEIEKIFAQIDLLEQNKSDLQTTIKQAKSKILDLAIHGKLVSQDPNDEPASVLLEKICAEKEAKIAKGELKRDKNDSYIYKGSDNCHYQKNTDGSIINIEDEIPFEVPESWCWCRFGEICEFIGGVSYKKNDITNTGIRILRGGNIQAGKIIDEIDDVFVPFSYFDKNNSVYENDIVLVASTGSNLLIGKTGFAYKNLQNTQIGAFLRIIRTDNSFYAKYNNIVLLSEYYKTYIRNIAGGTNINNVKTEYLSNFLIPLPPLTEQTRIVAKIEELFTLLDNIQNNLI